MDAYVMIATKAIEKYVKTYRKLTLIEVVDDLTEELYNHLTSERAGAFVSIHKNKQLRGCIGTTEATTDHLFDEIVYCAISACSSDPRFNPVREEELPLLEIKVDRLYPAEVIDSLDVLDVIKYGVIVEKGTKRGLLLPNLDGVNNVDEQVSIALNKAGISGLEGVTISRFEVERHS
mgnify:CR=1 FL=1